MMKEFKGIFTATITPFTESLQDIDEGKVREHADYLVETGVHGLIPSGGAGEFTSMTLEERKRVLQATLAGARGRVPVIFGARAATEEDTIVLCKYAEDAGADGVMLVAPFYCKPAAIEIIHHYERINRVLNIPIMLYNNPGASGVDLIPQLVAELAKMENIRYIKESSGDIRRVAQILQATNHGINVFMGWDTIVFEALMDGAVGWVSAPSNAIPHHALQLYDLVTREKDLERAREFYFKLLPLCECLEEGDRYVPILKALTGLSGHPMGDPRRPLLPLVEREKQRLKDLLAVLPSLS